MTFEQLNTAHASALDTGEIPSPATPEGDAISRGAAGIATWALDQYEAAIRSDYEGTSAFHPMMSEVAEKRAALRSLPPQDGERHGIAALSEAIEGECDGLAITDEQAAAILAHLRERCGLALSAPAPVFATAGAEARYIADAKAGVYDHDAPAAQPVAQEQAPVAWCGRSSLTAIAEGRSAWMFPAKEGDDLAGAVPLYANPAAPVADPERDASWRAGAYYTLTRLCSVMKVDPHSVEWDGNDGGLDERADALIWRILRANDPDYSATPAPIEAGLLENLALIASTSDGFVEKWVNRAIAALRAQSSPVVPVTPPPASDNGEDVA